MSAGMNREVQGLLPWNKNSVRMMLQLATATKLLGGNESSGLKLITHRSINKRMVSVTQS